MFNWEKHPHRRLNPLTGEWVLVSAHRAQRPWQGQIEPPYTPTQASYDPECYLCPGNDRASGQRNPMYEETFAFENDFPALFPGVPPEMPPDNLSQSSDHLLVAHLERGVCRVLCFSPRHDGSLPRMSLEEVRLIVDAWCSEYQHLSSLPFINYVQIFENRGQMAGASNPHPHCQIWASETIPNEVAKEHRAQQKYMADRNSCLLCDYVAFEREGARLVYENDGFAVIVPFWAVWPFEVLLVGRRHTGSLCGLTGPQRLDLARALREITTRYDNLFGVEFPFTMGIHQEPSDGKANEAWHLHFHFYPPLLRSAGIRKFMVGYEMLAMPQRDLTVESAAERLRSVPGARDR